MDGIPMGNIKVNKKYIYWDNKLIIRITKIEPYQVHYNGPVIQRCFYTTIKGNWQKGKEQMGIPLYFANPSTFAQNLRLLTKIEEALYTS
jgi:hypothetical protein